MLTRQNGTQKQELYNDPLDIMIEMIENPNKDINEKIAKKWV